MQLVYISVNALQILSINLLGTLFECPLFANFKNTKCITGCTINKGRGTQDIRSFVVYYMYFHVLRSSVTWEYGESTYYTQRTIIPNLLE